MTEMKSTFDLAKCAPSQCVQHSVVLTRSRLGRVGGSELLHHSSSNIRLSQLTQTDTLILWLLVVVGGGGGFGGVAQDQTFFALS
jgi:hypothetical protein